MTSYNSGDVVLIKFPFANLENHKKRPALVIRQTAFSKKESLVIIAMITSRVDGVKIEGDCSVQDWQKAGLLHSSLVRLSKLATVDNILVDKKLGTLTNKDLQKIKKAFTRTFKFWV